ncbi:MAG: glycosyltransferase family 4 protein [Acidobacteriaceae bacterium]|nr:glycosyltransferase family 4 protein [Acidobacteriaceae bacterium]MBV8570266.1 glycosyltransferase family 4 protein [Acidobacteriaceae bacterium]
MRILILNQAFHPDVVATAHYSAHLAEELAARGHEVTAVAGLRAYDNPAVSFPRKETWRKIRVRRIATPGLGKSAKWRRLADFASFLLGCAWQLLLLGRQDVVIALTSPPLIGFLAALFVRIKGGQFLYWVMDLNPDQALAAGLLHADDPRAQFLEDVLRFTLTAASRIVVLDRFMKARICGRVADPSRVSIIPPWSHASLASGAEARREKFRREYNLENKFVVMYAGNHSPCHPLDTLVHAAENLAGDREIVFCFVGGGIEHKKIAEQAQKMGNILCLPYPRPEELADPLFAADLHVAVMGDAYLGIVHPCKVYNILALGTPLLYIGPEESHVTDVAASAAASDWFYSARHGDVQQVCAHIRQAKKAGRLGIAEEKEAAAAFSQRLLLMELVTEIEGLGAAEPVPGAPPLSAAQSE